MKELLIDTQAPYRVLIGAGLLGQLGGLLTDLAPKPRTVLVVTDTNVGPLYAERALAALGGFRTAVHTVPAGEAYKTPETLMGILHAMAREGLTRSDLVLTLGGGVVGDMAGFAAAVYQRGMRFVQCPTTLLSAVDASVGGKTAVDLPEGKNMIGAFHQPSLVVFDPDTLKTLPEERISDGAAEMVKHAVIADSALFERLRTPGWRVDIASLVARNVEIKRSFVVGDERDRRQRQLLNFGHTIGHAVEAWSGFTLSHGQAVAIGMVMETRAARRLGLTDQDEAPIAEALAANGLPTMTDALAGEILRFALHDKKRQGAGVTVAVPVRIGEARLQELDVPAFERYIAAGGAA